MQTVSRYLITNLVTATISGYNGRNAKVYDRRLKVYRGVSNPITFTFKNEDQKAQFVNSRTYEFNLIDTESNKSVLTRNLTILDDGSTVSTKGQASVTITDGDLISLDAKFYNYAIREVKSDNSREVTYADSFYNASGTVEILSGAYPEFVKSIEPSFVAMSGATTRRTSGNVFARPGQNNNSALHTVAAYWSDYTGNFKIQGTLAPTPAETDWTTIQNVNLSNQSGITYYNFNGVYENVRFTHDRASGNNGSLDKLLYRL
tara:strand:+ start:3488 stop:4270 length:783 start_codon:yes stop_codon:yes gene_type:complete